MSSSSSGGCPLQVLLQPWLGVKRLGSGSGFPTNELGVLSFLRCKITFLLLAQSTSWDTVLIK